MPKLPTLTTAELARFRGGVFGRIVLVALALVPSLYGGLMIWSNLDVTTHLHRVPAAVVNLDKPVKVTAQGQKPQTVALGRMIAASLTRSTAANNLGWTLTSADDAAAGLRSGRYYAVLTLPATMSKDATSSGTPGSVTSAQMDLQTNDAVSYLAGNIASSVTTVVTDNAADLVTRSYLDKVYLGFNGIHTNLADASSGSKSLATGASKLAKGAGQSSSGAGSLTAGLTTAATGASQLAAGARSVSTGAGDLATGARKLSAGANTLHAGLSKLAAGTDQLPAQTTQLATGAKKITTGATQLGTGARTLGNGATAVATGASTLSTKATTLATGAKSAAAGAKSVADAIASVDAGASSVATGVDSYTTSVDTLSANCAASGASATFCAQLAAVSGKSAALRSGSATVAAGTGKLSTGATASAKGMAAVSSAATALATGAQTLSTSAATLGPAGKSLSAAGTQLSTGASQLQGGLNRLAKGMPALRTGVRSATTGASSLDTGARKLADGNSSLAKGAKTLSGKTSQLSTGLAQLKRGSSRLQAGLGDLASGATDLSKGATKLATGLEKGVDQIPSYDASDRKKLSTTMANPVTSSVQRQNPVPSYGYGLAPYFAALGLWVGAMGMFFVLRPVSRRSISSTAPAWRVAFAGFAPAAMIGLGQVAVLFATMHWLLDMHIARLPLFLATAALLSVTCVAVNQALVATLGTPGRFFSLLFTVLQLSAAGATYPIESTPGFFQAIHPFLPLTYGVQGLRAGIAGGPADLGHAFGVLALWLVGALLVTTMTSRRQRTWTITRLRPQLVL